MAAWDSRCGADVQARLRGFGSLQDAFRIQFVGVEVSELARSLSAANLSASASQAASGWKGGRVQLNRGGGRIAKARSNSSNFRNVFFRDLHLGHGIFTKVNCPPNILVRGHVFVGALPGTISSRRCSKALLSHLAVFQEPPPCAAMMVSACRTRKI